MNLQTVVVAFIQSGVILGLALVACQFFQKNPAAKLLICRVALVASAVAILGSPWLHSRPRPVVPVDLVAWNVVQAPAPEGSKDVMVPETSKPRPAVVVNGPAPSPTIDPLVAAGAVWLVVAVGLASILGVGYCRLSRLRGQSSPIGEGSALDAVMRASSEFGVELPDVLVSESVPTPFVAGIKRPTLFLPSDWLTASDEEMLDAICRHEVAHLASQDLRWNLAHRLCSILFWPQPLFLALTRAASLASEEACDRRVLESGWSAYRYADSLLKLKAGQGGSTSVLSVGIGAISTRSAFGRRIHSIMENSGLKNGLTKSRKLALTIGSGVAAVATILLIGAPSWREKSAAKEQNPFAPLSGHAVVNVVTPDGKPATGHVWLMLDDFGNTTKDVDIDLKDGKIDVDLGQYSQFHRANLVIQSSGYGLTFKRVFPVQKPVTEIQLNRATRLSGRAFLPDGKPAVGQTVYLHQMSIRRGTPPHLEMEFVMPRGSLKSALSARTDEFGRFQIDGLPRNVTGTIEFDDPAFASYGSYDHHIDFSDTSETACADVHLVPAAFITGRVTQNGKPVAGVGVAAQQQNDAPPSFAGYWGQAVTDANGVYRIPKLVASSYNVALQLQDNPETQSRGELTGAAHEGVKVVEGQTVQDVNFALVSGGFVSGTVTNADGSPAVGAQVGCYGPAHPQTSAWVQSAVTDKKGSYRLRVPAGQQHVYLMVEIKPGAPQPSADVSVRDGETTTVNLQAN